MQNDHTKPASMAGIEAELAQAGNVVTGGVLIRADQVQPGMTFRCTSYPGVGIRTCQKSWVRKTGGETTIMIDCGVGISSLELVPSDELEVLP